MKQAKPNHDFAPQVDPFWQALTRVLDHYLPDERTDYQSCSQAVRDNHICRDLELLHATRADLRRLDVHRMLAQRRQVAIVWATQDVLNVRPHLTEDQAWDVLVRSEKLHDCNYGFTWDLLESVADDMYPAASNNAKRDSK